MTTPNPAALDFLLTRRSRPAKTLIAPYPDKPALRIILQAAARTPDHGKLEPWRFIVLEGDALLRLAELTALRGAELGLAPEKIEKARSGFANAGAVITVVASPVESPKVPEVEQILSAGAVCLAALNAGLASGWGANWLTDWMAMDRPFLEQGLGLAPQEFVAGFIHLGTERTTPPERPRPDIDAKTEWLTA